MSRSQDSQSPVRIAFAILALVVTPFAFGWELHRNGHPVAGSSLMLLSLAYVIFELCTAKAIVRNVPGMLRLLLGVLITCAVLGFALPRLTPPKNNYILGTGPMESLKTSDSIGVLVNRAGSGANSSGGTIPPNTKGATKSRTATSSGPSTEKTQYSPEEIAKLVAKAVREALSPAKSDGFENLSDDRLRETLKDESAQLRMYAQYWKAADDNVTIAFGDRSEVLTSQQEIDDLFKTLDLVIREQDEKYQQAARAKLAEINRARKEFVRRLWQSDASDKEMENQFDDVQTKQYDWLQVRTMADYLQKLAEREIRPSEY